MAEPLLQPSSLVTVIVPLRDELDRLDAFLQMIEAQTLPPSAVVVADGASTDGSRQWLDAAAATRSWLRIVSNPRRSVPAALNVALSVVAGDLVARMDTHGYYAPDYLEQLVKFMRGHPDVAAVGGAMRTEGRGPWGRAIAATLSRSFGLGGARHRVGGSDGPVEHVFTGCYRTQALQAIGGWDERLLANEDYEADQRVREAGGVVWLLSRAQSTWFTRESPRQLAVQMFRYGYYRSFTVRLHPNSIRARQLAPPIVVLTLTALTMSRRRVGLVGWLSYLGVSAFLGQKAARDVGADRWRGAAVPAIVHLSWGTGFLVGTVTGSWRL